MYTQSKFKSATEAFEYYYFLINHLGLKSNNTKMIYNTGFLIENPMDNDIKTPWRKFNKSYAEYEFNWYLSQNRSVRDIKKIAKIWDTMHSGDDIVNSNYGWQWNRNNQLDYVINELKRDPTSRRAVLTIYDGKEHDQYKFDTPCTLSIVFCINDNKLCMTVTMRSNTTFICNFLSWKGHRATRINVSGRLVDTMEKQPSGVKIGVKKWIPSSTRKGTADISATIKGRSVMIEIKVGSDKPREHQLLEQIKERKAGGIYEFIKTPEEFFDLYDSI